MPFWVHTMYVLVALMTGGLLWLLADHPLGKPPWAMQRCHLKDAEYVLVQMAERKFKLAKVRGYPRQNLHGLRSQGKRFVLDLAVYVYDQASETFERLPDMPTDLPNQILRANEALQEINAGNRSATWCSVYLPCVLQRHAPLNNTFLLTRICLGEDWSGFNKLSAWPRRERCHLYGSNDAAAARPSLLKTAWQRLSQPIFVVQFIEIGVIFWEQDYKLAVLLLAVTLGANSVVIARLYSSRLKLYKSVCRRRFVPIVHAGQNFCQAVDGVWKFPRLPSMQASEVRKSSIGRLGSTGYHPTTHHAYTVHSGTTVEQVWNEEDAQEEVLAMVVRTGLHTSMGAMIAYKSRPSTPRFIKDYFIFCAFSLALQILAFLTFLVRAKQDADDKADAVERVVDLFVAAWPSLAPAVILFAVGVRITRLQATGISVLQPDKLDAAAHTEIVCFDKTGTLTANMSNLHGMLPLVEGQFLTLQLDAVRWPNDVRQAAAVCNALTLITKSQVAGELGEREAFNKVEARFVERNVVTFPLQTKQAGRARQATLQILKRFEFELSLMRSGVVAVEQRHGKPAAHGVLIIKGAAAVIQHMVGSGKLPHNYREVVDEWSAGGFRVLAVAQADIPDVGKLSLSGMSQQQVEDYAGSLDLVGLVIISNHVNPDSKATVKQLQERGGLRLLMVTGDYYHTAIAVGRAVGMVPSTSRLIIIQTQDERRGTSARKPKPTAKGPTNTITGRRSGMRKSMAPSASSDLDCPSSGNEAQPNVHWLQQSGLLQVSEHAPHTRPTADADSAAHVESTSGQSDSAICSTSSLPVASLPDASGQTPSGALQSHTERCTEGLALCLDNGDSYQDGDMLKAFQAISEGEAPCCITGPAFDYLLQQPNQVLIQTVMLNCVAFTCMKANQKGQLMELLGRRGLHQVLNRQQRHIPGLGKSCLYCGDGINDLAALAAADVGMALGSAEASAAATLTDRNYSVAGVCTVLREARALQVILVAIVKFMVLYQLADQMSVNMMFFLDNSNYNNDQSDAFDFIALAIGAVAALRPSAALLFPHRRLPTLCHFYAYFSVLLAASFWCVMYTGVLVLLEQQSWYPGGNGSEEQCHITYNEGNCSWSHNVTQPEDTHIESSEAGVPEHTDDQAVPGEQKSANTGGMLFLVHQGLQQCPDPA
ncbi:hypothetical protein ABBQ38_014675 [Trebouxia sp. C0009 RCD-2024]